MNARQRLARQVRAQVILSTLQIVLAEAPVRRQGPPMDQGVIPMRSHEDAPDEFYDSQDPRIDQSVMIKNLIDRYKHATPEEAEEGRDWYQAARQWIQNISDKTGGDYSRAAALTAALSPKTRWEKNMSNALQKTLAYQLGKKQIAGLGHSEEVANAIHDFNPNALAEGNHGDIMEYLNSPKVRSFFKNMMGDDNAVTIDTHMLRAMNLAYGQRPVRAYGGNIDSTNPDAQSKADEDADKAWVNGLMRQLNRKSGMKARAGDARKGVAYTGYNAHANAVREAVKQINAERDPKDPITPAQLQAIVWTQYKGDMDRFDDSERRRKFEQANPGKPYREPTKAPYVPFKRDTSVPFYEQGPVYAEQHPFKSEEPRDPDTKQLPPGPAALPTNYTTLPNGQHNPNIFDVNSPGTDPNSNPIQHDNIIDPSRRFDFDQMPGAPEKEHDHMRDDIGLKTVMKRHPHAASILGAPVGDYIDDLWSF